MFSVCIVVGLNLLSRGRSDGLGRGGIRGLETFLQDNYILEELTNKRLLYVLVYKHNLIWLQSVVGVATRLAMLVNGFLRHCQ